MNLKQELMQSATDVLKDPRAAVAVSTGTTVGGMGDFLNIIPWGAVVALPGAVLSCVMIYIQLSKWHLERRRELLEIRALRANEEERKARRVSGEPMRRAGDG